MIENILWLWLIPAAFVLLMVFVHMNFVKDASSRKLRHLIFITRFLTITLLLIGLAAPFTTTTEVSQGDTAVTILYDLSHSMDVYKDKRNQIVSVLGDLDRVDIIPVGDKFSSPIGTSILNAMLGKDSILLVSDGNVNSGKELRDVLAFAASIDTTVNVLELEADKKDASIAIIGPKQVLANVEGTYYVTVENVGDVDYDAVITLNGQQILTFSGSEGTTRAIPLQLKAGFHKLEAKLTSTDANADNDIFRMVVHALDKPSILYVTDAPSPAYNLFTDLYDVTKQGTIPADLSRYFAIVFDNVDANKVSSKVDTLRTYVRDGNGLFVIGGENSYDLGAYDQSQFESLLPAHVGAAAAENITELNTVFLIDISVSSGLATGTSNVINVQKAQAIKVFSQMEVDDYLAVVAFNKEAHTIVPLKPIREQFSTPGKIEKLQNSGGTYLEAGMIEASSILNGVSGNKNIIVFSDGKTKNPEAVLELTRNLRKKGINTYALGVGPGTDLDYMSRLANAGGGLYLQVGQENQLGLVFGDERSDVDGARTLKVLNSQHFITNGLELSAILNGYNQVVPKSAGQTLVTTENGIPILTVWRFGLGRVATLSTDGGQKWAGDLLKKPSSQLYSRTANWVIGDPRRRQSTRVYIDDGRLEENLEVSIISDTKPENTDFSLTEVDVNLYKGVLRPDKTGYFSVLGEEFAVSYPREYQNIEVNPDIDNLVAMTEGQVLSLDRPNEIIEKIRTDSEISEETREYFRELILGSAIILFLLDIYIRRKFAHTAIVKN